MALAGVMIFLSKVADLSQVDTFRLTLAGLVSGFGGYGLNRFRRRRRPENSSRSESDHDTSSS